MYPDDLMYSEEHEWLRVGSDQTARVGITQYAADALSDIVYASLPKPGDEVNAGDSIAELESTKSVSEVYSPVSGVVTAVNEILQTAPETINADPYGDGWLFEVSITQPEELEELLDSQEYQKIAAD
ncbi:MAG: glycine cleavage system protein GcvH [Propionibacteriaceae bacterium]|nr:glycine cleavage system protein GcvH [Propionibacteriaceae bacterium]